MIRRSDVVVVDFPFPDTGQSKIRPALVVQNDRSELHSADHRPFV